MIRLRTGAPACLMVACAAGSIVTPRLEHSGCIEMHAAFQAQPSLDAQPLLGVRLVTE
jgi:hypothetical protein